MGTIDWNVLGAAEGQQIEDFAAACLRQQYPDALQTKPAQGDGGIDVYRKTDDGLVVWQIKKYSTPLSSDQKNKVDRSWKRFWDEHVSNGTKIARYHLCTPWTPTEQYRGWFNDVVSSGAEFPRQWDGAAFFEGLASNFPQTYDRFFKGPNSFDSHILAKSVLAASPVEAASSATMISAVRTRHEALRDISDRISDTYFVNHAVVSSRDEFPPLPSPDDPGIIFRFEAIGDNRFLVESIVPKTDQSMETDPVSVVIEFQVEADSREAFALEEWRLWGKPFKDVPGNSCQVGGPIIDDGAEPGLISFILPPNHANGFPDLEITSYTSGVAQSRVSFHPTEVTRGRVGGGTRIVGRSPSKVLTLEMRVDSTAAPSDIQINLTAEPGGSPESVLRDLELFNNLDESSSLQFGMKGFDVVFGKASGITHIPEYSMYKRVALALRELQEFSVDVLTFPDIAEVTLDELTSLEGLVGAYRGQPFETTWEKISMVVPEGDEFDLSQFKAGGFPYFEQYPQISLGGDHLQMSQKIAMFYSRARLDDQYFVRQLRPGDQFELVPDGRALLTVGRPVTS